MDENGERKDGTLDDIENHVGLDAERLRRLRLIGFLRELVRQEGRMAAAELLGVNYKTLVRAEESGRITGRVGDALERLMGAGSDSESDLRERVGALERRVEALAKELRNGLERMRVEALSGGNDPTQDEDGAFPPVAGLRSARSSPERRPDPEVVTERPADGDAEVYGEAWPLVAEWRRLRHGHPHLGKSLSWLTAEERLLSLELAMLERHGLTLPPETQPLRGFGRGGQTGWRRTALADTRRALARRRLLRWVRRVCTLGLWWR